MAEAPVPPDATITVDANSLRRLAEAADGLRGGTYALSTVAPQRDGGTGLGLVPVDASTTPEPGEIRVHTPLRAPDRLRPKAVFVQHPKTGEMIAIDVERFDAVMWGEAAIEKFLVPYYARFQSAHFMQTLRDAVANAEILAIAHEYPSFVDLITDQLLVLPTNGAVLDGRFVSLSEWLKAQSS